MAYQLPTEIQHMIWTYSMYNLAKGWEFRKHIQEGWFKLRLRRLSNALENKSQDIYHQELGQLLLSMDELLNLPGEMRLRFHKEMLKVHYSKFHSIDKARVWVVRMKNLTLDKLYSIRTSFFLSFVCMFRPFVGAPPFSVVMLVLIKVTK